MFSCNSPCNPTGKQFLLGSIKMFVCLFVFVQKKKQQQPTSPIHQSSQVIVAATPKSSFKVKSMLTSTQLQGLKLLGQLLLVGYLHLAAGYSCKCCRVTCLLHSNCARVSLYDVSSKLIIFDHKMPSEVIPGHLIFLEVWGACPNSPKLVRASAHAHSSTETGLVAPHSNFRPCLVVTIAN